MGTRTNPKRKSKVTTETEFCMICGRRKEDDHHLLFGTGRRKIGSTDDLLTIPLCSDCHTAGRYRLHDNPTSEFLSKLAGQLAWEREHILEGFTEDARQTISDKTRAAFIERYGKSWT